MSLALQSASGRFGVDVFNIPTWVAGEDAKALHKNWSGSNGEGWKPNDGFKNTPQMVAGNPFDQRLIQAVHDTLDLRDGLGQLLRLGLLHEHKPDVIYFMTMGIQTRISRNGYIKQKKGRENLHHWVRSPAVTRNPWS